jgi:hypothetical protein
MKPKAKSRLYALTALACAIWFAQSIYESVQKDQLFYWPNVVFDVCLLVIIGYTGYCAVKDWNAKDPQEMDASQEAEEGAADDAEADENSCIVVGDTQQVE